jgi:hypothetical protein
MDTHAPDESERVMGTVDGVADSADEDPVEIFRCFNAEMEQCKSTSLSFLPAAVRAKTTLTVKVLAWLVEGLTS